MTQASSYAIGLDLGGTKLRLRLHDPHDQCLTQQKFQHTNKTPAHIVACIADQVHTWIEIFEIEGPIAFGAALAAMLGPHGQSVRVSPNLHWRDVPFAKLLTEALPPHVTIHLFNDLKAAVYGEYTAGAGRDYDDVLCVFVGSGVGSGFVMGGQLHTGATHVAGEFGHVKVNDPAQRRCGCGGNNCLEAYVGGVHLAAIAQEAAQAHPHSPLAALATEHGLETLHAGHLDAAAQAGDPVAQQLLQRSAHHLGVATANLLSVLNPACLILGGSVLQHCEGLRTHALATMHQHISTPALDTLNIATPQLGDDAGLLGAIALARQAFSQH